MFELHSAYGDLVAVRRSLNVSRGVISEGALRELDAVLVLTKGRVYVALASLDERGLEKAVGSLEAVYGGETRVELERIASA